MARLGGGGHWFGDRFAGGGDQGGQGARRRIVGEAVSDSGNGGGAHGELAIGEESGGLRAGESGRFAAHVGIRMGGERRQ